MSVTSLDLLKYLAWEGPDIADHIGETLLASDVPDDVFSFAQQRLRELKGLMAWGAVNFCNSNHEDLASMRYSDGRRVRSTVELEPEYTLNWTWHPEPGHPTNQPGYTSLPGYPCPSGAVKSVMVGPDQQLSVVQIDCTLVQFVPKQGKP